VRYRYKGSGLAASFFFAFLLYEKFHEGAPLFLWIDHKPKDG
jgi:hypothetical protein